MNKFLKKLKSLYKKIIQYIYMNRLFLIYLILALFGAEILRYVTVSHNILLKPFLADLAVILFIGAFGYLVKPKNQFKYYFTWIIIFTICEIINSIYYTFYEGFASFSQLSTLSQTETVVDSIFVKLKLMDFIYIIFPVIFYYVHNLLKQSSYYNLMEKIEKKKKMVIATIVVSLASFGIVCSISTNSDFSRLARQWDRSSIVDRYGILVYQFNDVFQTIIPKVNSLFGYEKAYQMFKDYFDSSDRLMYTEKNSYSGLLEGYNIVYIHMESMQNFLMDLSFNGEEVTPNLKKIASEGMFFDNFYPQISTGTSSDAEYIMLTGLLPSSTGTVFVSYYNNTFISLPTLLKEKGYYTFSMHGNYPSMWDRNKVHPQIGYTDMYFHDTFTFDDSKDSPDVIGLGLNDKLFFKQAVEKLETIEENNTNYFGTMITLSNHSPFNHNDAFTLDINDYFKDPKTGEDTSTCYLCNRDIGKYIVSSHYADEALGDFINYIKESDAFQNTVFIFYGDHDAKMSYKDMNYLYNYDPITGELKDESDPTYMEYDVYDHNLNKKTPLIIWTKNKDIKAKLHGKVSTITGMYDVAPTLYNMLNIDNKYVLGHDIFNIKNNNIVVFPNGNYLTNKVYYNSSTGKYKTLTNNVELDEDYIAENQQYAEKALDVGNAIIAYDLFNERKGESE